VAPYGRPWRLKSNWEMAVDGEVAESCGEAATLDWDLVRMLMPMIAQVPMVDSCLLRPSEVTVVNDGGGCAECWAQSGTGTRPGK
jgi:hypothetical protein